MPERSAREPSVLLHESREPGESGSFHFSGLEGLIEVRNPAQIEGAFAAMEAAIGKGFTLAGATSYELGYCFEDRLQRLMKQPQDPLILFGIFRNMQRLDSKGALDLIVERGTGAGVAGPAIGSGETRESYVAKIATIREYIAAGDIYQANFTFPLNFKWSGDVWSLYGRLSPMQRVHYGAVLDLPGLKVASLSPELFFRKRGSRISSKPMKGTMRRGASESEDRALALSLRADAKNRAENLMIVDLIRNDLSRIAKTGSVGVEGLFTVETYETLHQMVSTVRAELATRSPILDIFRAIYPCGSVTGAPKIRAMEIIAELERSARGIYTGAIGYITPERDMCFSVPIRTAVLREPGEAQFGTGSGIVWDSVPEEEYEECLLKARFLRNALT